MQSQASLNDQIIALTKVAFESGISSSTIDSIISKEKDILNKSEMWTAMDLANKAGLYDAADYIRNRLTPQKM